MKIVLGLFFIGTLIKLSALGETYVCYQNGYTYSVDKNKFYYTDTVKTTHTTTKNITYPGGHPGGSVLAIFDNFLKSESLNSNYLTSGNGSIFRGCEWPDDTYQKNLVQRYLKETINFHKVRGYNIYLLNGFSPASN